MSSTAPEPAGPGGSAPYAARGFLVVRGLVPPDLCTFLTRYLALLARNAHVQADEQVTGSHAVHGDAAFDTLLEMAQPAVAELVGRPLVPTYSYARLYHPGNELVPHRDRGACEHSVTVHLESDEDEPWPLWLRDLDGTEVGVTLAPGDAVLYLGRELEHWRRPYTGRFHAQLFLHYVDAEGPDAVLAFDGRSGLGASDDP